MLYNTNMDDKKINVRVRLVIIKNGKILLHFTENGKFYFYTGGHLEFGETIKQACEREAMEETGANFTFKKILYIRDFIHPEDGEHSVEFFILGDLDKFEEIEGLHDPQSVEKGWKSWQNWIDLEKLKEINVKPKTLTRILLEDYKNRFTSETRYLGEID